MKWVQPLPDFDAVDQVLLNIEMALKMYQDGMNFFDVNQLIPIDNYPAVANILSWLSFKLGLASVLKSEIYSLLLLVLVPFSLVFIFLSGNKTTLIWIHVLVLFFPITQMSLKSCSWHSFNLLYSFLGILIFLEWRKKRNKTLHFFAILFLTLSVAFKHLGIIQLFSMIIGFWLTYPNIKENRTSYFILISPLFLALPVYLLNPYATSYLTDTLGKHSDFYGYESIDFITIFLILTLCIYVAIFRNRSEKPSVKIFTQTSSFLWFLFFTSMCFCSFLLFWALKSISLQTSPLIIPSILAISVLLSLNLPFVRNLKPCNDTFIYKACIIQLSIGFFLFFSAIGFRVVVFQLPALLCLMSWVKDAKQFSRISALILFLVWGNFFPGTPESKRNSNFYSKQLSHLFHQSTQNPWNWKPSQFRDLRTDFQQKTKDFHSTERKELYCLITGLDDYMQDFIFISYNHDYDNLTQIRCNSRIPHDVLHNLVSTSKVSSTSETVNNWLKSGDIAFIYEALPIDTSQKASINLEEILHSIELNPKRQNNLSNIVHWILHDGLSNFDNIFEKQPSSTNHSDLWVHPKAKFSNVTNINLTTYLKLFSSLDNSLLDTRLEELIHSGLRTNPTILQYHMIQNFLIKLFQSRDFPVLVKFIRTMLYIWPNDVALQSVLNSIYRYPNSFPIYHDLEIKHRWAKLKVDNVRTVSIPVSNPWYPLHSKIQSMIVNNLSSLIHNNKLNEAISIIEEVGIYKPKALNILPILNVSGQKSISESMVLDIVKYLPKLIQTKQTFKLINALGDYHFSKAWQLYDKDYKSSFLHFLAAHAYNPHNISLTEDLPLIVSLLLKCSHKLTFDLVKVQIESIFVSLPPSSKPWISFIDMLHSKRINWSVIPSTFLTANHSKMTVVLDLWKVNDRFLRNSLSIKNLDNIKDK